MTSVTDVMVFATNNVDYWQELFSGDTLPEELTEDEAKAVEAAVAHIGELTVELLHGASGKLVAKVGESMPEKRHLKAATIRNRCVWHGAPDGLGDKLYGLYLGLEHNRQAQRVDLYGSLTVKKGALDDFKAKLDEQGIEYAVDDYDLYPPYIALTEGAVADDLAEQVAEATFRLLEVLRTS
jgi:hypothetical protein